jgi:hypothetical protein
VSILSPRFGRTAHVSTANANQARAPRHHGVLTRRAQGGERKSEGPLKKRRDYPPPPGKQGERPGRGRLRALLGNDRQWREAHKTKRGRGILPGRDLLRCCISTGLDRRQQRLLVGKGRYERKPPDTGPHGTSHWGGRLGPWVASVNARSAPISCSTVFEVARGLTSFGYCQRIQVDPPRGGPGGGGQVGAAGRSAPLATGRGGGGAGRGGAGRFCFSKGRFCFKVPAGRAPSNAQTQRPSAPMSREATNFTSSNFTEKPRGDRSTRLGAARGAGVAGRGGRSFLAAGDRSPRPTGRGGGGAGQGKAGPLPERRGDTSSLKYNPETQLYH